MVDPKMMCNQHLLGEHVELHMLVGTLKRKKRIVGFIAKKLLEPRSIQTRHDELVLEMNRRGMQHKSPLSIPPLDHLSEEELNSTVDEEASRIELLKRCPRCQKKANRTSKERMNYEEADCVSYSSLAYSNVASMAGPS